MTKRTAIFSCLITLFTALSTFAGTSVEEWTPRSPLEVTTSLHAHVMAETSNKVKDRLTTSCLNAIRDHLTRGGDFFSDKMQDPRFSTTLLKHPSKKMSGLKLYHYTKAPEVKNYIEQKNYDPIFNFLRASHAPSLNLSLYVASDDQSSEYFGKYLLEFTFSRNSKVFYPHGIDNTYKGIGEVAVLKDIFIKNEELKECEDKVGSPGNTHFLVLLAAEASRIDLIAYGGVDNLYWPAWQGANWFQLLNSWSIVSSRYVRESRY